MIDRVEEQLPGLLPRRMVAPNGAQLYIRTQNHSYVWRTLLRVAAVQVCMHLVDETLFDLRDAVGEAHEAHNLAYHRPHRAHAETRLALLP